MFRWLPPQPGRPRSWTATSATPRRVPKQVLCLVTQGYRSPSPQHNHLDRHAQPHRHLDLPLQAPAAEAEAGSAGGAGHRAGKKIAAWEDDPMIGTATFVMLIAATAIADNAYPPCTQQRTDNCSAQQQAPGPTLYIPCPKGEYCPPHDIPRPKKQR